MAPIALVAGALPVLMLNPTDGAAMGFADHPRGSAPRRRRVLDGRSGAMSRAGCQPLMPDQPDADAVWRSSFYAFLLALAQVRGTDVDRPRLSAR